MKREGEEGSIEIQSNERGGTESEKQAGRKGENMITAVIFPTVIPKAEEEVSCRIPATLLLLSTAW